ncbi:UbiA prenyltransferase [Dendrothele bispora CBS 962.96]|uniref:UbiA prenyltransferase n=1 Tax=Dendrothele bispora (strain CBS 962.96) TaxID=1314807 RepID=A0A4S8M4K9_DENBC|nr:UbiA prenyltransferase [Dendrothele bispora CBS 962.96]
MPSVSALIELSRIDRFAGTLILFWPYGGGCVWNDIIDMDLDAQVERTKHRPLPSGKISVIAALAFLSVHLISLFGLSACLNPVAWNLAFLTVVPLTGIYPFMKRITYLPQVWLGITLNTPVLLASAVFKDNISVASAVLALGCWSWTMWYDTIYGSQDKKDDVKAGVKSIVLLLDHYTRAALCLFATCIVTSWIICGILAGSTAPYYAVTVGGGGFLLAQDLLRTDLDDPKSCLQAFERNGFLIGPIVWLGFLMDYIMG